MSRFAVRFTLVLILLAGIAAIGKPAAGASESPPWSNMTGTVTVTGGSSYRLDETWEGEWSVAVSFTPDLVFDWTSDRLFWWTQDVVPYTSEYRFVERFRNYDPDGNLYDACTISSNDPGSASPLSDQNMFLSYDEDLVGSGVARLGFGGFAVQRSYTAVGPDCGDPSYQKRIEELSQDSLFHNTTTYCYENNDPSGWENLGTLALTTDTATFSLACTNQNESDTGRSSVTINATLTSACEVTTPVVQTAGGLAAALSAAATTISGCGTEVKITEPTNDQLIALTDSTWITPQAGDTERAPAVRYLKVRGSTNASTVVVNGVTASVSGGAWRADVPVWVSGPLELTANAGSTSDSVRVSIVELAVSNPSDQDHAIISMAADPDPAMPPSFAPTVRILGHPDESVTASTTFTWRLEVRGQYRIRSGWIQYANPIAVGTTIGNNPWRPTWSRLEGGFGKLVVTASIPGVANGSTISSDPVWFDLQGQNPSRSTADAFITAAARKHADIAKQLFCLESSWRQFGRGPVSHPTLDEDPALQNYPDDLPLLPDGRPLFGAAPAGTGFGQLDPGRTYPSDWWDWQANVKTSLGVFEEGYARSAFWTRSEQNRLNAEYQAVENFVNDGLPKKDQIHGRAARVPRLSEDQRIDEALKEYNSGASFHQWRFGTNYVPSPDGRSIVTITAPGAGADGWVSDSGQWAQSVTAWAKDPAGMEAGNPMSWIVGRSKPDYVSKVRGCVLP